MAVKEKLTAAAVDAEKLRPGMKQQKLMDGAGLYLLINGSGKYWRYNYRFDGKHRTMALGVYPSISLKEARAKREDARRVLDAGNDPGAAKQKKKREAIAQARRSTTFEEAGREWFAKNKVKWAPSYAEHVLAYLEKDAFPWIGSIPIEDITAADVLGVLRKAEDRGAIETAHKLRSLCGQIFRYAVATNLITGDPTSALRGALVPIVRVHRATITEPARVGELMRAMAGFHGTFVVHCALNIAPYVFVRPGELRQAEWSEINLHKAEWNIPAEKMKMRKDHIVPLSKQVVTILRDLQKLTGRGRYVFPSIREAQRPMSENTLNACFRRLGYDQSEICAHGFRAMARTLLHEELDFKPEIIEHQLAHQVPDTLGTAYNRTKFLKERRIMMQAWADYLDDLKQGAAVIPLHTKG